MSLSLSLLSDRDTNVKDGRYKVLGADSEE